MQTPALNHTPILLAALLLVTLTGLCPVDAANPAHPNLVVILADDLGYGDLVETHWGQISTFNK